MSILGPISLEVYSWDADWLGCNGLISYCVWGFFWGRRIQWWLWKELKSKVYWVFILGYIILDVLYSYKKKKQERQLGGIKQTAQGHGHSQHYGDGTGITVSPPLP